MVILQGDVFWFDLGSSQGSGPGFRRPFMVVQNDIFNAGRIQTTVLCALTSNLNRAKAPGNVLLRKGEANLPRPSVVNISQVFTADKSALKDKIGTLSPQRIQEVVSGLSILFRPRSLPRPPGHS